MIQKWQKWFYSPQNLTSRKIIWFQIFSFTIKPLFFFSTLWMFIYKYRCFHVHISVFGTYREAQKHIDFLSFPHSQKCWYLIKKPLTTNLVLVLSFKLGSRKKCPYMYIHVFICLDKGEITISSLWLPF